MALKKTTILHSWAEFEDSLKEMAVIDAAVLKAEAARALGVLNVQVKYDEATGEKVARRGFLLDQMEGFYGLHRKEIEQTGKKSRECPFGIAGVRKGAPKLALSKGWKWDAVLAAMRLSTFWSPFVKEKFTVDKQGVKGARATEEQMAGIGVRIAQREEFFVDTYPEKLVQSS